MNGTGPSLAEGSGPRSLKVFKSVGFMPTYVASCKVSSKKGETHRMISLKFSLNQQLTDIAKIEIARTDSQNHDLEV
jgi:hypothetical protein